MHVSDPNASFIEQARHRLDKWSAENSYKSNFSFSVTPAERADEAVAKGSVDLITLMQCAHWTDQDAMVHSVATSLASNGTLAIIQINPTPMVVGNETVNLAVRQLFEFWGQNILEARRGGESLMGTRYLLRVMRESNVYPYPRIPSCQT